MKKLNLFFTLILLLVSSNLFSQDMTPPKPITSSFLEQSMGTWVSAPYEFMGGTNTDEVTQSMILNGQFMQVDVKSTNSNGFVYEGMGIIAPSEDGTMTGWFYDIFGKNGITTYTGNIKDNVAYLTGTSSMGTETRNIYFENGIMLHNVIYNWKSPDGKDMPEQKMIITYNKKN